MAEFENLSRSAMMSIRNGYFFKNDALALLDWLDKIRIGLWRYQLGFSSKHHSITPRFAINKRIGSHDRVVWIQRTKNPGVKGIALIGTNHGSFLRLPSVFGLVVRDVAILSFSNERILYDFFGMSEINASKSGKHQWSFRGMGKFDRSIFDLFYFSGVSIFQFRDKVLGNQSRPLLENIFVQKDGASYSLDESTKVLVPRTSMPAQQFSPLFNLNVTELQLASLYYSPFYGDANLKRSAQEMRTELNYVAEKWVETYNSINLFRLPRRRLTVPHLDWQEK